MNMKNIKSKRKKDNKVNFYSNGIELLLKEIEDKAKEDIAKHNSMQALIEKENNDEDEKLDPEDPELRSVFIAGQMKFLFY